MYYVLQQGSTTQPEATLKVELMSKNDGTVSTEDAEPEEENVVLGRSYGVPGENTVTEKEDPVPDEEDAEPDEEDAVPEEDADLGKYFSCRICGNSYRVMRGLQNHLIRAHEVDEENHQSYMEITPSLPN